MMPHRGPIQAALLSVVLLGVLATPTLAWDFLKKKHSPHCDGDSYRGEPRAVTDTFRVSRGVPAIGTVFVPIAAMPVGISRSADLEEDDALFRTSGQQSLRAAQLAERATVRGEQARAAAQMEIDASKRVLERMGSGSAGMASVPPDLDKRLTELKEKIDKLAERVSAVEKLVLIHDNYLKEQLQKPQGELIPAPQPPPKPNGEKPPDKPMNGKTDK